MQCTVIGRERGRMRWSTVRRVALLHRTGVVPVGESAVIAVVSAPHRDEAFAAARFCIDALKATVPIWKREEWSGGASWGLEPQHITEVDLLGGATACFGDARKPAFVQVCG